MKENFVWLPQEEFWILCLAQSLAPVDEFCVGKGGVTSTTVDIKIVMRRVLQTGCSSIILFHNHPSGSLRASQADISLTNRLVNAAGILDIRVNDHIIVTDNNFYSFYDNGIMPQSK